MKNGYYDLSDISELDIPDKIKKELKEKFNKLVFYDDNGSCRVGTLTNFTKNYYIIESNNILNFVPIWKRLTIV